MKHMAHVSSEWHFFFHIVTSVGDDIWKKIFFLNNEVGDSTTSQHFCFSVCHSASKGSKNAT